MDSKNKINNSLENLRFAVLATDVVCFRMINNQLSVLLSKTSSTSIFSGKWALVGGLILEKETAEQSAERHLLEKAGINNVYKEQLYTFSDIGRDPRNRVVSVAYMALASNDPQDLTKAKVETKWLPVNDLPVLAYDHNQIVKVAIDRLRSKIGYTNIAQYLLPEEFTLSDLQAVYETLIGETLDKRNFRRKILDVDILIDTKHTRKQGVMRPATLYKFSNSKKPKLVNIL